MDVTEPASVVLAPGAAAVLRTLAGADTAFTIRQLARIAGVSHSRAHQVVHRLAEHGLVLAEQFGNAKLCRLNRDHLAADIVIQLTRLRAKMVELLRREIAGWKLRPDHASLFGSAARGDGDTSSDLDVLVVRPAGSAEDGVTWEEQLLAAGQRIYSATGNHVAWFDISIDDMRRSVRAGQPLIDEWRRDSIDLAGTKLGLLLRELS